MDIRVFESNMSNATNFLIAEDIEHVREIMQDFLRETGFKGEIVFADTESEAQTKSIKSHFNFFILDWNLKKGSGLDLINWLRKQPQYLKTPILMITGKDSVEDMLSAVEAGANAYLIKPWTIKELEEKISEAWNNSIEA